MNVWLWAWLGSLWLRRIESETAATLAWGVLGFGLIGSQRAIDSVIRRFQPPFSR